MSQKALFNQSRRSMLRVAVSCLLVLVLFFSSIPLYPSLKVEKANASTNLRIEPSEINNELGEKTTISFSFNAADSGQEEHDIKINLCIPGTNGGPPQLQELIASGTFKTKNAQGEYIVHEVEWDGTINGVPLPEGRYYIAVSPASYNGIGVYYGQIGSFEIINSQQPSPPASIEVKAGGSGQAQVSGISVTDSTVEVEVRDQAGELVRAYDGITVNAQGQWKQNVSLPANKLVQISARSHRGEHTSSYGPIQEVLRFNSPSYSLNWGQLAAYFYKASTLDQVERKVAELAEWNGLTGIASDSTIAGVSSILLINPQTERFMQQGDAAQFTADAIQARLNIVNPLWSDYVDPARGDFSYYTGELYLQAIMPLSFGLSYLSRNEHEGSVGLGWLHSYEWLLSEVDGKQELLQPDGSRFEFIPLSDGTYLTPRGTDWLLQKSGSGHLLKDLLGTSYSFTASGQLGSITDTNGNKIDLTYQGERLYKVSTTDASLTLSYNGEGKLTAVSDHTGRGLSYQYNNAGDMVAFTDADGSVTSFTYDDAHHVIAVSDPAQTTEMSIVYDEHMRVIGFTDYYGNKESAQYEGSVAPVVRGDEIGGPGPTGPISIHPDNARDIPESDLVLLSGSMTNIHQAPPYKIVPGLKPVITDYLASLKNGITAEIDAYKQRAGSTVSSIAQIQQKIESSSGNEAVVVRTGYLNLEEDLTLGSPTKPVILVAEGVNTNKEITLKVHGNLILENGLNANTKLNLHIEQVSNNYGNLWAMSTIHLNNDSNVYVEDTLYAGALTYNSGSLEISANHLIVEGNLSINTEVEMNIAKEMVLGGIVSNNLVANLNISDGDLFVRDNVSVNNQMSVTAGGVFAIGGDMTANRTPSVKAGVGNGRTILNYPEPETATLSISAVAAQINTLAQMQQANNSAVSQTLAAISETKRTNALQDTTTYVWGDQFLLTEIKHPDGATLAFSYDDNERIAEMVDGNGYRSKYAYDARGNQLQSINGNGESTVARYNAQNRPIEIVDALGEVTTYEYDAAGNLIGGFDALGQQWETLRDARGVPTQITNERGDTTRYVNNNAGLVEKIIDPSGYELVIARDELNRVTAISDSEGTIQEMSYDAKDRATVQIDALQQTVHHTFDANGNLISVIDESGAVTTFEYDVFRHVATTDALGKQSSFEYDAAGNVVKATNRNGGTSHYHYDSMGRVVKEIDPDGNPTSYTYDAMGNPLSYTDGMGRTTSYTYNALGQELTVKDASNAVTQYRYDANGQLVKETNAIGNSTWYEYDSLGRLTSVIDALGNETSYSYDELDNLLATTDAEGNVWQSEFDERGYAVASIDPLNRKVQYTIDDRGRLTQFKDAEGNSTTYHYDALGRTTKAINALGQETTYSYNAHGQVTQLTDAKQQTTSYEYDALGQLIAVTDALGNQFSYTYDALGNLIAKTNPNGAVTRYSYTEAGLLESRVNPLDETTTISYDASGNMAARTEADGTTTRYNYDETGRIVKITYDDGQEVEYTYDVLGRRMTMLDSNGLTRYTYDALNRPTEIIDPRGQNVRYEWTVNSQRSRVIYPDNRSVSYTYNAAGQISNVIDGWGQQTSYAYDNNGRVKQRTLPTGATSSYHYDALGQIEQIRHQTAGGQLLEQLRYSYDAVGNVLRKERQEQGSDEDRPNNEAKPVTVEQYDYDALNQLIRVEDSSGSITQYAYDEVGNRIQTITADQGMTVVENYTYDLANKLLHWENGTEFKDYSYDLRGNLLQVTGSGSQFMQAQWNELIEADLDAEVEKEESAVEEEEAIPNTEEAIEESEDQATEGKQAENDAAVAEDEATEPEDAADIEVGAATSEDSKINDEAVVDALPDPMDKLFADLDRVTGVYPPADTVKETTGGLDGELTEAVTSSLSNSVVLETYSWDAANRLISQVNTSGDTTSYRYDGDNNRVYMGVSVGNIAAQNNYPTGHPAGARTGWEPQYKKQTVDIYFTNDTTTVLPQPLYATDESGTGWKQSYVYGADDERISMSYLPSADESTDWEPVAGASGAAPNTTPETLYYLEDSQDTVLALLNNDDQVALRYHYDAFGVATDAEKFDLNYPGPDNLFGYTGLGYDASSGLSYARARYFDSSIGRFISQDTYEGQLDNPLSLNLYTYVENNPLRYVDPTGNFAQVVIGYITKVLADYGTDVAIGVGLDFIEYIKKNYSHSGFDLSASIKRNSNFDPTNLGIKNPIKKAQKILKIGDELWDLSKKIAKSNKAIEKVLKGSTPGRVTKGKATQVDKKGGYKQAVKDFDGMGLMEVRKINKGKIGKLPDGRTVNVREYSSEGSPTLEIYDGKKSIKVRYK